MRQTTIVFGDGIDVAGWSSACSLYLGTVKFRCDVPNHLLRHLVLQVENIFQSAVKSIGPQMSARRGVDELPSDPHATTRLAHAAFEHVTDTQITSNLLDVDSLAFVGERRVTGDDEQRPKSGQSCYDVLHHPVGKKLLLGIA